MGCDEWPLEPLEGMVHPREVAGEHVMPVLEEVSIFQWHGGARHGQKRFIIASIQVQGNAKPVDNGTKINL